MELMNVLEELDTVLTLDQAPIGERGSSTQQLLDELLGHFDDDDSLLCLTHGLKLEPHADFDD
jgi:hypothetical protein